ncbi:hypothetical protein D3C78_1164950 [compost metagenome]
MLLLNERYQHVLIACQLGCLYRETCGLAKLKEELLQLLEFLLKLSVFLRRWIDQIAVKLVQTIL